MSISLDKTLELAKETTSLSMISAGGVGIATSALLGRLSPGSAARVFRTVMSPVLKCPLTLAGRAASFENYARLIRDKKEAVGAFTAIAGQTIKGLSDNQEARIAAKEQADQIAINTANLAALAERVNDMSMRELISEQKIMTMRGEISTLAQENIILETQVAKLKAENVALKEAAEHSIFGKIAKTLNFG